MRLIKFISAIATLLMIYSGFKVHAEPLTINIDAIKAELEKVEETEKPHTGTPPIESSVSIPESEGVKCDCKCAQP